MKKIKLEEILFTEVNKMRKDFPDINLYSNEEMKSSPEWEYYMNAMKEACRQVLELAAENVILIGDFNGERCKINKIISTDQRGLPINMSISTKSILNTINQLK